MMQNFRRVLGVLFFAGNAQACTQLGCDSDLSNNLNSFSPPSLKEKKPTVAWETSIDSVSESSQLLCASSASESALICVADSLTAESPTASTNGIFSVDTASGKVAWASNNISASSAYPLLDIDDGSLALTSDGSTFAGFTFDGQSLGEPVAVTTDRNGSFALTSTDNGVVMIVERSGLVSGYLTNGVVHASIHLQGTDSQGRPGQFVPMGTPAVTEADPANPSGRNRVIMLTAFESSDKSETVAKAAPRKNYGVHNTCRVYALDVQRTIDKRIEIAWYYEFDCEASSATGLSREKETPLLHISDERQLLVFPTTNSKTGTLDLVGLALHEQNATLSFATPLGDSDLRVTSITLQPGNNSGNVVDPEALVSMVNGSACASGSDPHDSRFCLTLVRVNCATGALKGASVPLANAHTSVLGVSRAMRAVGEDLDVALLLVAMESEPQQGPDNSASPLAPRSLSSCNVSLLVVTDVAAKIGAPQTQRIHLGSCESPGVGNADAVYNTQIVDIDASSVVVAIGRRLLRLNWA